MDSAVITSYLDKIYKFSLSKTFSEDEAEDLSQEIILNVIASLPKLRDESRFEPWLWSLALNTARAYRRSRGRQREIFVYDAPPDAFNEKIGDFGKDAFDGDREELYGLLREKIVMLSKLYREIIILHYYDGLSTKEIAKRLNIPLGTVTWRLSAARDKLKKECNNMEKTALKPVKLHIGIYGSGNYNGKEYPYPSVYISDALSQNILFNCYDSPKTVEELAKLCGVPAYYIEERIENLVERRGVKEVSKGKFQTDFIISDEKQRKFCEENAEKAVLPLMDRITAALDRLYAEAEDIGFYRGGRDGTQLKYILGAMTFDYLKDKYCKIDYPKIPENYDGNRWRYVSNNNNLYSLFLCFNRSKNADSRGTYQHTVYKFSDFGFRPMMCSEYINVCEDILTTGKTEDKKAAACAVRDGYILRLDSGELSVEIPAFTKEQKEQLDRLTDEIFAPIIPDYSAMVEDFVKEYKKLFPKHLEEDAQRRCHGFFSGFYDVITSYCVKNGIWQAPKKEWICDVLVQWK